MGRLLLVGRLAVRDLRRRRTEAALLLLAIVAATTTLTLGLVLRDAASDPYQSTRAATNGPDVVVSGRAVEEADDAPGITGHSGPYPVATAKMTASGRTSDVQAVGRDTASAPVDQPRVIDGGWVIPDGVVLEAAFAHALHVRVGDSVTLNGRPFRVAGVAVTAAGAPYPATSCLGEVACAHGALPDGAPLPAGLLRDPGRVWLTRADVRSLSPDLTYVTYLRLGDPDAARAFALPFPLRTESWQEILGDTTAVAGDSQILLLIGAWLLGLLAVAGLAVLVGGRMADQTVRVGLLKAVGGTPGLVAAVLLAEYVLVAVVAAAAGLTIGSLTAPLLTESSAGLIGSAGPPPLTLSTAGVVAVVAVLVAVVATAVPAIRAARSSTVRALAGPARAPRRVGWLIAASARLPVPLLLALRVAARRPRRVVLGMAGLAVTVSGIYVALILDGYLAGHPDVGGYDDAQVTLLRQVIRTWIVILLVLAAVNVIVITWATVLDNRHASALARALGATPREVSAALAGAQVLPALAAAVLGVFPGGYGLFAAIMAITGGDGDHAGLPSLWQLVALVLATMLVVAILTAVPARLGGRRPVAETLRGAVT